MRIFKNLILSKKYQNSVLAIGNFDGVHIGHKRVLKSALKKAKKTKKKVWSFNF